LSHHAADSNGDKADYNYFAEQDGLMSKKNYHYKMELDVSCLINIGHSVLLQTSLS
jgi:hypothetical protein